MHTETRNYYIYIQFITILIRGIIWWCSSSTRASKQFRLQFGMSYIPYTIFACGTFITYLYNTIFVDLINIAYTHSIWNYLKMFVFGINLILLCFWIFIIIFKIKDIFNHRSNYKSDIFPKYFGITFHNLYVKSLPSSSSTLNYFYNRSKVTDLQKD